MMNIIIKPVSKDLTDDFLHFFDDIAFTDNKDWAGCYCYFYHYGNDEQWFQRTAEDNRMSAIKAIEEGKMRGYLAYNDGQPIGWCNANDKNNYERLRANNEIWDERDEKVCSIVCFIIAPEYRNKGIASQLLDVICDDCSKMGYDYVEAYPRKGELSSAGHYHGPLSMYMKAGFSLFKSLDSYDIVRKKL